MARDLATLYDDLDGCDLDFVVAADDEETAELRALFPEGVADDRWDGVLDAP